MIKQLTLFSLPEREKTRNLCAKQCFFLSTNKQHRMQKKLQCISFEQQKLVNFIESEKNITAKKN